MCVWNVFYLFIFFKKTKHIIEWKVFCGGGRGMNPTVWYEWVVASRWLNWCYITDNKTEEEKWCWTVKIKYDVFEPRLEFSSNDTQSRKQQLQHIKTLLKKKSLSLLRASREPWLHNSDTLTWVVFVGPSRTISWPTFTLFCLAAPEPETHRTVIRTSSKSSRVQSSQSSGSVVTHWWIISTL